MMAVNRTLEIACFNSESVVTAQSSGADRIELCEDYSSGGITPSQKIILEVRKKISIPLHVIIRPRAGDFIYSHDEIETMKTSLEFCRENKIDGVVFGVLTNTNEIRSEVVKELITLAGPMSVTFHRAIDVCENINAAFEILVNLGINRILTSGSAPGALKGLTKLTELQNRYGHKISIMPGGGIRSSNFKEVMTSGCKEFHSAAITDSSDNADAKEIRMLKMLLNA